ncbi:MAG: tetratricopeptide repeat protein [Candidatus Marinimicrobia bacterium]|nr:tetratricopeptide repeat protein [Candidatus Neomarinimicrobiota bacterium]
MKEEYISAVEEVIERELGEEFLNIIYSLREEREKFLNNVWNSDLFDKSELITSVRRSIDFDLIYYNILNKVEVPKLAKILLEIGDISLMHSEYKNSILLYELLLEKYKSHFEEKEIADIFNKCGQAYFWVNDLEKSLSYFKNALKICRKIDDRLGIVRQVNAQAIVNIEMGKIYEGERLAQEALMLLKDLNKDDERYIRSYAGIMTNLGNVNVIRGYWDEALNYYNESKKLISSLSDVHLTKGLLYYNLALVHLKNQDYKIVAELLGESISIAGKIKNKLLKALALSLKAEMLVNLGKLSEATALVMTSFAIYSQINNRPHIADVYRIMGIIKREEGDYEMSLSFLNTAENINMEYEKYYDLAETYVEFAKLYKKMGDEENKEKYKELAIKNYKEIFADKRIEELNKLL